MAKSTLKGARKATRYRAREAEPEKAFDKRQSRLNQSMQTYSEVMGGDEDQFHMNRDKMLLDDDGGPSRHDGALLPSYAFRQSVLLSPFDLTKASLLPCFPAPPGYDDSLDEDDEIYGLDLPTRSASPSEAEEEEEEEEEEETPAPTRRQKKQRKERKEKPVVDLTTKGRFGHTYDPKQDQVFDSSSGSEGGSDDDDEEDAAPAADQLQSTLSDEEDERKASAGSEDDSEEERWAAGHYHVSRRAPGEADSEDEEALELEAEEARRLQRKRIERMRGEDYGLGDAEGEDVDGGQEDERLNLDDEDEKKDKGAETDTAVLTEEESIAHLLKTSPETLALLDDFVRTASKIKQVETDLEVVRETGDGNGGEHPALAIMELEHQALTTYLPTLAFYFSLLLAPIRPAQSLLDRVLARLSSLRQSLATMEELDLTSAQYGDDDDDESGDDESGDDDEEEIERGGREMLASEMFDFNAALAEGDSDDDEEGEEITDSMLSGVSDGELEDLMASLGPDEGADVLMAKVRARQAEKGLMVGAGMDEEMEMDEYAEMEQALDEDKKARRKARKAERKATGKKDDGAKVARTASSSSAVPALAPLSSRRSAPSSTSTTFASASDYLDPHALSHTDSADKSSARHSLRFHVSQVAQKAARRSHLATKVGGDDDVPRRSKEQARREMLKRQQHGADKDAKEGAGLDAGEWDEEDKRAAKAGRARRPVLLARRRPARSHAPNPRQQGSHAEAQKGEPQRACQEARPVRQGAEEAQQYAGDVQGRRGADWVRGREVRDREGDS
ncbi:SPOSA6832_02798, partial [Sporobolomyces salmonicolor]